MEQFLLNEDLSELVGIIIGDGCLYGRKRQYLLMISGNIKKDKEYYDKIGKFIFQLIGRQPRIKIHQRALRIIVKSKSLYRFFVNDLNMKYDGDKTYKISIPQQIVENWNLTRACLRGLIDTDGCIFIANKPGSLGYPSIELTTVSKNLAFQVKQILKCHSYRIKLRWYDPKNDIQVRTYKLALNGWNMLKRWYTEIGFSHPVKKSLAAKILKEKFGGVGEI